MQNVDRSSDQVWIHVQVDNRKLCSKIVNNSILLKNENEKEKEEM
jgi:hypothetical protein